LQWIHGPLNARNDGTLGGSLVRFDQTEFIAAGHGMDAAGWLYVPTHCAAGQQCRLHVALHGCLQGYARIGAEFLNNAGYNRWADTNDIIVLYPQAVADTRCTRRPRAGRCRIRMAVGTGSAGTARISTRRRRSGKGHHRDGRSHPRRTTARRFRRRRAANPDRCDRHRTTSDSITLGWSASAGATGYNVYRDDGKVQSTVATSFTDGGLAPATTHSYSVSAVDAAGESGRSGAVSGTTASTVPYSQKVSASALGHYLAGRITVAQYLQLGQEYGYLASFTLYLCGSTWTNSPTCGPLH